MTKKEIAKNIAEELGLSVAIVKEGIQRVFDGIIETLVAEGRIEFRNFGVFKVITRKPRRARNPMTGEAVMVPEHRMVRFKAGLEMAEKVERLGVVKR